MPATAAKPHWSERPEFLALDLNLQRFVTALMEGRPLWEASVAAGFNTSATSAVLENSAKILLKRREVKACVQAIGWDPAGVGLEPGADNGGVDKRLELLDALAPSERAFVESMLRGQPGWAAAEASGSKAKTRNGLSTAAALLRGKPGVQAVMDSWGCNHRKLNRPDLLAQAGIPEGTDARGDEKPGSVGTHQHGADPEPAKKDRTESPSGGAQTVPPEPDPPALQPVRITPLDLDLVRETVAEVMAEKIAGVRAMVRIALRPVRGRESKLKEEEAAIVTRALARMGGGLVRLLEGTEAVLRISSDERVAAAAKVHGIMCEAMRAHFDWLVAEMDSWQRNLEQ